MKKYTQLLVLLSMMLSCNSTEKNNAIIPSNMNNNNPPRTFLALGDSYTIGESVDEKDRWSVQLIDLLKADFNFTRHDIIARTGWTTGKGALLWRRSRRLRALPSFIGQLCCPVIASITNAKSIDNHPTFRQAQSATAVMG